MADGNYCVVEFIDSKELGTVPSSWISEEFCTLACAWPPGKRVRKLSKTNAPVDPSWTKYPCEILHTFDTYEDAIKKERFLESFSDLEWPIVEQLLGPRKRKKKIYSSSEEEEEEEEEFPSPDPAVSEISGSTSAVALPDVSSSMNLDDQEEIGGHESDPDVTFPGPIRAGLEQKRAHKPYSKWGDSLEHQPRSRKRRRKVYSCFKNEEGSPGPPPPVIIEVAGSTSAVALPDVSSSMNFDKEEQQELDSYEVSNLDFSKRLDRLEKFCAVIQKDVKQVLDLLRSQTNDQLAAAKKLDVIENYLPLTNMPALYEFESHLADSLERREELRIHLQQLGGSSTDDMVKKMLRHIFTDNLAQHFSWYGQKGKNKLCDLFLMKCLFQAVATSKISGTREQIENRIKEWFRQASTRNKHLMERQCRVFYS